MSEEYSNGYARGYEAGQQSVLKLAEQLAPATELREQEPWGACVYGRVFVGRLPEHARKFSEDEGVPIQWLYTSPQPAQRTWVGLTHEEVEEVWEQVESSDFLDCVHPFARAIEAKLRSKNEDRN